jgi:hypothetical protein
VLGRSENVDVVEGRPGLVRALHHHRAGDGYFTHMAAYFTHVAVFTYVAVYEAEIAVRGILGQNGPPVDCHARPWVTFTDSEIGAVGMPAKVGPRRRARGHGRDV